ncbi:hypothetical protein FisN_5Lh098 [Fistulifera solaris]|uniref:Uncharacterized protein n=1 Tax=Fistulifera solaris TaxID=1519565 RepID=A0A1Z5JIZ6_FISSO|nr:hypothetical protein FisN_5Lh098 [Fistulifera solaris]|eukprot:GAX13987.1 hypothetical protein FisN_5Lh098 [Fistulifera solaris]
MSAIKSRRLSAPVVSLLCLTNGGKKAEESKRRLSAPPVSSGASDAFHERMPRLDPYSKLTYELYSGCCSYQKVIDLTAEDPRCVSVVDPDGKMPLHVACQGNADLRIVQFLYQRCEWAIHSACYLGQLPLHVAVQGNAPKEIIQFLVEKYPEGLERGDGEGRVPLHLAVSEGMPLKTVELLVSKNPEALCKADDYECLPLHYALMESATTELIRYWAREYPDALVKADNEGRLPLHLAIIYDHEIEVIEFFVRKCDHSTRLVDAEGCLPLHLAILKRRDVQVIRLLVSYMHKDALVQRDFMGRTPLDCVFSDSLSMNADDMMAVVEMLVDEQPVLVSSTCRIKCELPLHKALQSKVSMAVVRYLINAYRPSVDTPNSDGKLPIHIAIQKRQPDECLRMLLLESPESARMQDNQGRTPFQLAYEYDVSLEIIISMIQTCPDLMSSAPLTTKRLG